MIVIELKDANEAQVLVNLINIAVKSVGLEAAESGLYFANLIKAAAEKPKRNRRRV